MKRMTLTLALAGASAIGFANTSHAMTLPTPSALKEAVPSNTSQVFWRGGGWGGGWRGGGWGPGIGFGIAAGALTAAAVASTPYWGGRYYGYASAYPYAYAPYRYARYAYGPVVPRLRYGAYGAPVYGLGPRYRVYPYR